MLLRVTTLITTLAMVVINLLANIVPYNNQTTAQISDSFPVFFVPAGYVFSIWGVIYIALLVLSVYSLTKGKENKKLDAILPAIVLSNIANSVWIFLWHFNQFTLSIFVMLVLLASLLYAYVKFNLRSDLSESEVWGVKLPISIYLGWISVATIANVTVTLFDLGWNGFGIGGELWAAALVVVATLLAVVMMFRNRDIAYAAVIEWAVIGIAIKFFNVSPLNLVCLACASIIALIAIYTIYKKILK